MAADSDSCEGQGEVAETGAPMDPLTRDREIARRLMTGALVVRTGPSRIGSAVMVKDRVLTALHVVSPPGTTRKELQTRTFDVGMGGQRTECVVDTIVDGCDLAVLYPLDLSRLKDVPRFSVGSGSHVGDPVWVGGYPFGTEVPVVRRGTISAIVMPEVGQIIDRSLFTSESAKFPSYWIDVPIFPGNSGGPVLDSSGELIGIAVQALYANHLLDSLPDPHPTTTDPAPDPAVPIYLDVGIAVRLDVVLGWSGLNTRLVEGPLTPPPEPPTPKGQ